MKIALIDDHQLALAGLSAVLNTKLEGLTSLVACESVQDLLKKNKDPKSFDLILLDYHLPRTISEDNFKDLKNYYTKARICFISSDENAVIMSESIKNGAAGFIVKSSDVDLFVATIQFVMAGGTQVPAEVIITDSPEAQVDLLSPRQRDTFELLLQGDSNKAIAKKLCISESTVKSHCKSIFKELGISSRHEAFTRFKRAKVI